MKITIISISKFENSHFKTIFQDYQKRLPNLTLKEIEFKKTKSMPIEKIKEQESNLILKNLNKNSIIISLDENGIQYKSTEFAKLLENYSINGNSNIDFIIGGAFGLSKNILEKSHKIISLGKMTFAHLMVRIMLIEQIYRANSIISGHPYHKE